MYKFLLSTAFGNVIITDSENNRVDCYSRRGTRLWRIDRIPAIDQSLKSPSRAIIWNGYIVIADTGNDSVLVIDRADDDVKASDVIEGLKSPRYVMVDSKGRLIVSDTGNSAVKIYSLDGQKVKLLNTFTGLPGRDLVSPVGITEYEEGRYAIVDSVSRSLVFATEKELIFGNE